MNTPLMAENQALVLDTSPSVDSAVKHATELGDTAPSKVLGHPASELCHEYLLICQKVDRQRRNPYVVEFGPSIILEKLGIFHQHIYYTLQNEQHREFIPFDSDFVDDRKGSLCKLACSEDLIKTLKREAKSTKLRQLKGNRCEYVMNQQ